MLPTIPLPHKYLRHISFPDYIELFITMTASWTHFNSLLSLFSTLPSKMPTWRKPPFQAYVHHRSQTQLQGNPKCSRCFPFKIAAAASRASSGRPFYPTPLPQPVQPLVLSKDYFLSLPLFLGFQHSFHLLTLSWWLYFYSTEKIEIIRGQVPHFLTMKSAHSMHQDIIAYWPFPVDEHSICSWEPSPSDLFNKIIPTTLFPFLFWILLLHNKSLQHLVS